MSGRGHRASLPAGGHARPEYLIADGQGGLVVRHCNREGRVREYDFASLPVAGVLVPDAKIAASVLSPSWFGLTYQPPPPPHRK